MIDGEEFYEIQNFDELPPFLMTIVSSGDHWMYISSSGGMTMGRVSAENCFFPYITVDNLHDSFQHTGPITLFRVANSSSNFEYWQPFKNGIDGKTVGSRNLRKHTAGDQVIFEEINNHHGLVFRYSWRTSTEFGFVRSASLENIGSREIEVELVDGFQNICPSGVQLSTYQRASCLVDAYKHNEIDGSTGMGIYSLTSKIVDRAEAVEALRASTVWSCGLPDGVVFLSPEELQTFKKGGRPQSVDQHTGQRGF